MSALARRYYTDPGTGHEIIESVQDVRPVLEANKAHRNAPRPGSRLHHSGLERWYLVARIPDVLIEQWWHQGINFYRPEGYEYVRRKFLNSAEYEHLRTAPGRL